jgi:hypothetical protein
MFLSDSPATKLYAPANNEQIISNRRPNIKVSVPAKQENEKRKKEKKKASGCGES